MGGAILSTAKIRGGSTESAHLRIRLRKVCQFVLSIYLKIFVKVDGKYSFNSGPYYIPHHRFVKAVGNNVNKLLRRAEVPFAVKSNLNLGTLAG